MPPLPSMSSTRYRPRPSSLVLNRPPLPRRRRSGSQSSARAGAAEEEQECTRLTRRDPWRAAVIRPAAHPGHGRSSARQSPATPAPGAALRSYRRPRAFVASRRSFGPAQLRGRAAAAATRRRTRPSRSRTPRGPTPTGALSTACDWASLGFLVLGLRVGDHLSRRDDPPLLVDSARCLLDDGSLLLVFSVDPLVDHADAVASLRGRLLVFDERRVPEREQEPSPLVVQPPQLGVDHSELTTCPRHRLDECNGKTRAVARSRYRPVAAREAR